MHLVGFIREIYYDARTYERQIYMSVSSIYEFQIFLCFEIKRNLFTASKIFMPIPMATPSKAWVYGRSFVGIADSNPAVGMDVCLLLVLCVVTQKFLRRTDHRSRGFLPRPTRAVEPWESNKQILKLARNFKKCKLWPYRYKLC